MVPVLKTGMLQNIVGSNPTLSFFIQVLFLLIIPDSSVVERLAVNQNVVCSNHTQGGQQNGLKSIRTTDFTLIRRIL
jgi:hypothetical protein